MTPEQYWCLVKDHLIPSHTPASTPVGGEKRGRRTTAEAEGGEKEDRSSASTQTSESESSENEERPTKRRSATRSRKGDVWKRRGRPEESGRETDMEDREEQRRRKKVRLDPKTELRAITPRGVEPLPAAAILFKEAGIREAASFTMPEDWEDAEERGAYEGMAGRAISRLKAVLGAHWPLEERLRSADDLREAREEVLEQLVATKEVAAGGAARRGVVRDLFDAGPEVGAEGVSAGMEKEGDSGAAALAADGQPGQLMYL